MAAADSVPYSASRGGLYDRNRMRNSFERSF